MTERDELDKLDAESRKRDSKGTYVLDDESPGQDQTPECMACQGVPLPSGLVCKLCGGVAVPVDAPEAVPEEVLVLEQFAEKRKAHADRLDPMKFRKPTDAELAWMDPRTPRSFRQKVRITCPEGNLAEGAILLEDGEPVTNVARFFLDAKTSFVEGGDNTVKGVIVQYHPEIGEFVYTSAEVLLGQPLVDPAEADAGPTVPDLSNVLYEEPILTSERRDPEFPTRRRTLVGRHRPPKGVENRRVAVMRRRVRDQLRENRRDPAQLTRRQAWKKNAAGYDTFRPGGHRKSYGRRPGDGCPQ